jgi:hypothetical protein
VHGSSPTHFFSSATKITPQYQLGLSLGQAPQIDDDLFVGREAELTQLKAWLLPTPKNKNVVVLSVLGGVGKTQLSIHFAKHHHENDSSVIWLNAKDESTLKKRVLFVGIADHRRRQT